MAMFWATVMCGNRLPPWMTYPIRRRSSSASCSLTSSSPIRMLPEVGSISRLIIFSEVVLPQPDGPTNITISPAGMSRTSPRPRVCLARVPLG